MHDSEASDLLHRLLVTGVRLDLGLVTARSEDGDALLTLLDKAPEGLPPVEAGDHRRVGTLQEDHQVVVEEGSQIASDEGFTSLRIALPGDY